MFNVLRKLARVAGWHEDRVHIDRLKRPELELLFDATTSDIWVVQADGAYPVKLTANGAENGMVQPDGSNLHKVGDTAGLDPIWLPDGRIAFSADGGVASKALAVVSILNP